MTVAHAAHVYRIQNWYGSITDGVSAGEFTGGSNPDVLFPPWGRGSLVVAARYGIGPAGGAAVSGTTYPSGYTGGTSTFSNGAGGDADTAMQTAYTRTINSITNSGAFGGTFSGFSEVHSQQVAVRGYTIANVVAGTAFSTLIDDFTTDQLASLWTGSYGTRSVSGGRLHVNADTGYSAAVSAAVYRINGSHVQVQAFPAALNGGTANVLSEMQVNSPLAGTDAVFSYDAVTGLLTMAQRVGYVDGDAVAITYSSTDHAYWRIRVSGGKMYWDTSADASEWTNRRTATAASWAVTGSALTAQLLGHRDDGTTNTADWDNFNVGVANIAATSTVTNGVTTVQIDDTESQDDHNAIRTYTNDANLFASDVEAEAWGDLIIATHADDRPIIRMAFYATKSMTYRMQAVRRRVGDKITLVATNNAGLGISQDFFIENIKHSWSNGNRLWETTWELSPA